MTKHYRIELAIKLAATTVLATAAPTYAADNGWYFGVDLGFAKAADWCSGQPTVVVGGSLSCSDTSLAGAMYGGYQFNRYLSVQSGIVGFGDVNAEFNSPSASANVSGSAYGVNAVAIGTLPIGDGFGIFAKGGAAYMYSRISGVSTVPGGGTLASVDASGWQGVWTFGAGAKYDFWDRYTVRLTWDRYVDVGQQIAGVSAKSNIDMISVGVLYHF